MKVLPLIIFALWFSPVRAQTGELKLIVKKSDCILKAYQGDSLMKVFPVAVGRNQGDKQRRGDNRTPEGEFVISKIHDSRSWVHDFGDGKGPIPGVYGPWFLRLDTGSDRTRSGKTWTGIGFHGTHDPTSIGTMATEGCVRLRNEDLEELKRLVSPGTPVTIIR